MDFAMPYFVQVMREYTGRVEALDKKTLKKEEEEEKQKSASNDYVADTFMMTGGMPGLGGQAMLMPPQPMMGAQQMGGGMPPMGGAPMGAPQSMFPGQMM